MPTHRLISALTVLAALGVVAPKASAATYEVYSCRLPNGDATGIDGWNPIGINAYNDCGPGGGLAAQLPVGSVPVDTASGWRFAAPPDTTISDFTVFRAAED